MMHDSIFLMQPELGLTLIIIILLCLKVWDGIKSNTAMFATANILLALNFVLGFFHMGQGSLFAGMYLTTPLICFEKCILTFGTLIISMQSYRWLKDHPHLTEFYLLLFATLLGMQLMISSGNFLMFYLALELSTLPLASLANFDLEKRKSSESAFKLVLSSAFSSGILLMGISLLYGLTGTMTFSELPMRIHGEELMILAFVMIFAGFAFKISIVPFHLWTADVYEGAPVGVTSYLSVISKGAVVFTLLNVLYRVFTMLGFTWYQMVCVLAMLTMTIGNLFAMRQTNIKRFLAFSSITQAAYMLLGISGMSKEGMASVVFFVAVYVFSNLGAFGVVSLVSAQSGKEEIRDFRGFYKNNPLLSWILALSLFSLAGIPPTAGFFGKIFLFIAAAARDNYLFISVAALNMVLSLYYYLRVVRAVFVDKNDEPLDKIETPNISLFALLICSAGILVLGLWNSLYEFIFSLCN